MELNIGAIVLATVAMFAVGFVWYGPLFGKLWGQIHGFDKLSKEVQQKMMKEMGPYYAVQMAVTVATAFVFSLFITMLPQDWNPYGMAGFFWLGFSGPAIVGSVIFSNTEKKWMAKKAAVQLGGNLATLLAAAAVLSMMR